MIKVPWLLILGIRNVTKIESSVPWPISNISHTISLKSVHKISSYVANNRQTNAGYTQPPWKYIGNLATW